MFTVKIKSEIFEILSMDFLEKRGFKPNTEYQAIGVVGSKLLVADTVSGEMVELFPRNCRFIKTDLAKGEKQ